MKGLFSHICSPAFCHHCTRGVGFRAVRLEQQHMSDFDSLSSLLSGCAVKCILMGGASVKINRKDSLAL